MVEQLLCSRAEDDVGGECRLVVDERSREIVGRDRFVHRIGLNVLIEETRRLR